MGVMRAVTKWFGYKVFQSDCSTMRGGEGASTLGGALFVINVFNGYSVGSLMADMICEKGQHLVKMTGECGNIPLMTIDCDIKPNCFNRFSSLFKR